MSKRSRHHQPPRPSSLARLRAELSPAEPQPEPVRDFDPITPERAARRAEAEATERIHIAASLAGSREVRHAALELACPAHADPGAYCFPKTKGICPERFESGRAVAAQNGVVR